MRRLLIVLAVVAACGGDEAIGLYKSDGGGAEAEPACEGGAPCLAPDAGTAPIAGVRALFTDLLSGPNSGGQDGKGAFVTVYGNGFGAIKGSVTIGGGAADNLPIWVWLFSGGRMHSRIDHLTLRSRGLGAGSGSGIAPSS